ncbi:MAG: glutathione peroxidase [Bacteriovoracia bacterium]
MENKTVYDFTAKDGRGQERSLKEFAGKALLIVNTASECGFTPQYKGLEALRKKYHEKGLEVLGFPCNQFGGQEPGDDQQISQFCELNYGVSFPIFSKVNVNGSDAHPLFEFLKESLPGILGSKMIKWNFTKFLVSRDGKPLKRYAPNDTPESIEKEISAAL